MKKIENSKAITKEQLKEIKGGWMWVCVGGSRTNQQYKTGENGATIDNTGISKIDSDCSPGTEVEISNFNLGDDKDEIIYDGEGTLVNYENITSTLS